MTVSKGEYEMYNEPNEEIKTIAEKVASLLHADFMAVDLCISMENLQSKSGVSIQDIKHTKQRLKGNL